MHTNHSNLIWQKNPKKQTNKQTNDTNNPSRFHHSKKRFFTSRLSAPY